MKGIYSKSILTKKTHRDVWILLVMVSVWGIMVCLTLSDGNLLPLITATVGSTAANYSWSILSLLHHHCRKSGFN